MSDAQIDSRATEVTFFEDRARVLRGGQAELEPGRQLVRLQGASVLIDDPSLVVRTDDAEVRIFAARVDRVYTVKRDADDEAIKRLVEGRRAAARQLEQCRRDLARARGQRNRIATLEETLVESLSEVPRGEFGGDHWREAFADLDMAALDGGDAHAAAVEAVAEARRAEARAALLLDQARAEHPELRADVEVELEVVGGARAVEIQAEYFVPCALWRPSHLARLSDDKRSLQLRTFGTVWQRTGERWEGVRCRFSTARPTHAAEAPTLEDDWLRARPKTPEERSIVQVEARDVDIANTGTTVGSQADQMPGVDDGGEPLTLVAREAVTIPSNGEPFRVEVSVCDVEVDAAIVAYPERSNVPFMRARGTWTDDTPILAGPVVVMRGNEYAGRSRIDFASAGENFELGLGVDAGLSVHRSVEDEHKVTAVTGKNVLNRTVRIFASNLSDRQRHLTLVERVPVSEIEDVVVKKVFAESTPDQDGFIEFAIKLEPNAVSEHVVTYRVEYGSKVRLSW